MLCVADEEGVGCALAASVSGFFSSVAMALKPTGQDTVKRESQWKKPSANPYSMGPETVSKETNFQFHWVESKTESTQVFCFKVTGKQDLKRTALGGRCVKQDPQQVVWSWPPRPTKEAVNWQPQLYTTGNVIMEGQQPSVSLQSNADSWFPP